MVVSVPSDSQGDIKLNREEQRRSSVDLRRRDFLVRFCQGAGATLIPTTLWGLRFPGPEFDLQTSSANAPFHLHPHYRATRPLDATLLEVQAGSDEFITEKYADQIAAILGEWSASLLESPRGIQGFARWLADDFVGTSLQSVEAKTERSAGPV